MPAMTERDDGTIRKVIKKRIRHDKDGIHIAGDIDAVISANVGKGGSHSSVSIYRSPPGPCSIGRTKGSSRLPLMILPMM